MSLYTTIHGMLGSRNLDSLVASIRRQEPKDCILGLSSVPSKAIRKKKLNWFNMQLELAFGYVDNACPLMTVAKDYDIPRTSMRPHVMGIIVTSKRRQKLVLDPVEEKKLGVCL